MDANASKDPLFSEFGPVTPDAWHAKIVTDLKGADFEKSLVRSSYEGIRSRPFYTREQWNTALPEPAPGTFPYTRGYQAQSNQWRNCTMLPAALNPQDLLQRATDAVAGGAEALLLHTDELPDELLSMAAEAGTHLLVQTKNQPQALAGQLAKAATSEGKTLTFSIYFIPSADPDKNNPAVGELAKEVRLVADGAALRNQGANTVQEIAFMLSAANEAVQELTEAGEKPEAALARITFLTGTGTHYFFEIAKLRALRLLWSAVVKAYGAPAEVAAEATIHAFSTRWYQTLFDPYNNMLRATTEAMSAIIGGCRYLTLLPYDSELGSGSGISTRIARNVSTILREESYLDKAIDAAAGAYYLESLTKELADAAWALFQQTEAQGGYRKALQNDFIADQLDNTRMTREAAIAKRKEQLTGTNQFANLRDKVPFPVLSSVEKSAPRASSQFDLLRIRTLRYELQQHPRPQVHLALLGTSSMRKVRADFVEEFFALAGFDAMRVDLKDEPSHLYQLKEGRCIVLCAADEDYAAWTDTIADSLKASGKCNLVLLAGNPAILPATVPMSGIDGFVYSGANAVEVLTNVQMRLGIV